MERSLAVLIKIILRMHSVEHRYNASKRCGKVEVRVSLTERTVNKRS